MVRIWQLTKLAWAFETGFLKVVLCREDAVTHDVHITLKLVSHLWKKAGRAIKVHQEIAETKFTFLFSSNSK